MCVLVYENRALTRRIKQRGAENRRKKLHNEELLDSCCSKNIVNVIISRENEKGGICSTHGRDEQFIQDVVGTVKDKPISRCIGGRILLKRISQTDVRVQTGFV